MLGLLTLRPAGGGVSDHGLLSGLLDDDHTQYALADKSRPATWVAAADLAPRSLADLGAKDHHLLDGLTDDDHSIYALLSGRSGGQTLKGGAAASEHLTLQSTAHATRGYVRAQDDLQLLSDCIRGSDGTQRLRLATASPHLTLTGRAKLTDHAAIGGLEPADSTLLLVQRSQAPDVSSLNAISGMTNVRPPAGGTIGYVWGLQYVAGVGVGGAGTVQTEVGGLSIGAQAVSFYGTVTKMWGGRVAYPYLSGANCSVATYYGIELIAAASAKIVDAYGLKIGDITLNTGFNRLLDVGPATPYWRVIGGAAPAAALSNCYINVGGSLYQLRTRTINGYDVLSIN